MTLRSRPRVVTWFGILNLLFGGWTALFGLLNYILMAPRFLPTSTGGRGVPWVTMDMLSSFYERMPAVVGVIWIATGIGLLRLREWARRVALAVAIFSFAITVIWLWLFVAEMTATVRNSGGVPSTSGLLMIAVSIAMYLPGVVYPGLLLCRLRKTSIRAAFMNVATVEKR